MKDDSEGVMYKIEGRFEELENKLESKSVEMENLQKQHEEIRAQLRNSHKKTANLQNQFEKIESTLEGVNNQKRDQTQEVADLKKQVASLKREVENQCQAEVKKEVEKVLPSLVEQGLRDLPFEMVCAYKHEWNKANAVVSYDHIMLEFNNSDRPGGADGTMNIETGVFTTVTSGYYIVTFSSYVQVLAGEYTSIWLNHNGVQLEEGLFNSLMQVGSDGDFIFDQGSRNVVSLAIKIFFKSNLSFTQILHLLTGDTLDLRTEGNSHTVWRTTLCLYMAPAPYGI